MNNATMNNEPRAWLLRLTRLRLLLAVGCIAVIGGLWWVAGTYSQHTADVRALKAQNRQQTAAIAALERQMSGLNESVVAVRDGLAARIGTVEQAQARGPGGDIIRRLNVAADGQQLAELNAVMALADTLSKQLDKVHHLEVRLSALEAQLPSFTAPTPPDTGEALAPQAADIQALAALVRALSDRLDAIDAAQMRRVSGEADASMAPAHQSPEIGAALTRQEEELQALATYVRLLADRSAAATGVSERVARLERDAEGDSVAPKDVAALRKSAALALQTLDKQFQAILAKMNALAARDEELARGQEATKVALQTQLTEWREQHYPPVWNLAAQLAGITIQFLEAQRYDDPSAADEAVQHVATLLLASDSSLGIRVVGYADFHSTDREANMIVSQKRADAIAEQLVSLGVPEERVLAVGRGGEHRIVNSDAPGNANRRAVFEPFLLEDAVSSGGL